MSGKAIPRPIAAFAPVAALLAGLAASPVGAQTPVDKPSAPPAAVLHGDPEKAREEAQKQVKGFREAFEWITKAHGLPVAITWLYADNFVFVDLDGKKMTRAEWIQSGRISTSDDSDKQLKEQGGKPLPLTEDQKSWRPERFEVNGREITVYTWPVSKNYQPFPTPDGKTKLREVKVLGAAKQVYVKQPDGLLRLKRHEMVSAKIYVDGKPLSDEALAALLKTPIKAETKTNL